MANYALLAVFVATLVNLVILVHIALRARTSETMFVNYSARLIAELDAQRDAHFEISTIDATLQSRSKWTPESRAMYRLLREHLDVSLSRYGINLTPAARFLILLPIHEYLSDPASIRPQLRVILASSEESRFHSSIDKIVKHIATLPTGQMLEKAGNTVTTQAVVRAFAHEFCQIPPFCAESLKTRTEGKNG